jgi:hypothetical protein
MVETRRYRLSMSRKTTRSCTMYGYPTAMHADTLVMSTFTKTLVTPSVSAKLFGSCPTR